MPQDVVVEGNITIDKEKKGTYNKAYFRRNWRKETTAGGENSGESLKGCRRCKAERPNLSGKRTETYRADHPGVIVFSSASAYLRRLFFIWR